MSPQRFRVLARIQQAVAKVRFLLSFNLREWILSSPTSSRRRSPGLLDATDVADDLGFYLFGTISPPTVRTPSPPLIRSMSRVASGSSAYSDDVNQRAEEFIDNFYRQLRMERQISLELRYCNGRDGDC